MRALINLILKIRACQFKKEKGGITMKKLIIIVSVVVFMCLIIGHNLFKIQKQIIAKRAAAIQAIE
jgi:hypothetical protein